MNTPTVKKVYKCIAFYVDRNASTSNTFFFMRGISEEELKESFGIDSNDYLNNRDRFTMGTIVKFINDIINKTPFNLVSVSEDEQSMKYHFLSDSCYYLKNT